MKAVAIGPELNLEVRDVPAPEPGEGEVAIAVEACGICGSDLHMLPSGALAEGSVMGHEVSGRVSATGSGVEGWSEGDAVCVYPFAPLDHLDVAVAMGSGIGLGTNDGGYAEQLTVPAEMLWRLPEEIELAHGALVEPLAVGLHGIDVARAEPGQGCVVLGCGPIGAMTLVGLRARGFEQVVVVEPNEGRRGLAERLGASAAFGLEGVHEAVLAELGAPPEIVLECAGHVSARAWRSSWSRRRGGGADGHARRAGADLPAQRDAEGGPPARLFAYRPDNFDEAIAMLAAGKVPADELISSRRPLEDAAECFEELVRPGTTELKILLQPSLGA